MIQLQQSQQQLDLGIAVFNNTSCAVQIHFDSQCSIVKRNGLQVAVLPSKMATPPQIQQTNNNNMIELAQEIAKRQASLLKGPKTLFGLWIEWETVIAGNKAMKDVTHAKRGTSKATFFRQKVIWQKLVTLVNKGFAVQIAIDKIYGRRLLVSKIMYAIVRNKKTGGHPTLR
jgi:hypothetical protein